MDKKYVVAFNRDRDFYQIPLALSESGALDRLVTDLYVPDNPIARSIFELFGLSHRRVDGIPSRYVSSDYLSALAQLYLIRFVRNERTRLRIFKWIDKRLSRRSWQVSARSKGDLLLYSGYAYECFSNIGVKAASKGLFVFHPHGRVSEEVLDEDFANHKEMAWSHSLHKREIELSDDARLSEETRLSDYCICASEFTANSIRTISENKPLFVVPYGCFPPRDLSHRERPFTDVLRYLFVGQGVQRKGIHHLIKVWRRGPNRRRVLTIVGSKMDPAVLSLASDCKDSIVFKRGLTKKELELEYEQADIFVLPSLVEGFGLVYLEALSAGCFVIGTTNTGLPDLQVPSSVASVIKAGDLCQLEEALNSAAETVRAPSFDRSLIKAFAATRSWDRFREGIRSALRTIDAI